MHADLDTLCTVVYCTADDLLPEKRRNARREPPMPRSSPWLWPKSSWASPLTGASCGLPAGRSDTSSPYFPLRRLSQAPGPAHRGHRMAVRRLLLQEPGSGDDLLLLDSTPVECGRSLETARRSALADICGYGYSRSHSRWFWGCRLHLVCAPDGTPRAVGLAPADRPEREVALHMLPRPFTAARPSSATRATPAETSRAGSRSWAAPSSARPGPTRSQRPAPCSHPPTDRIGLLDLQGPAFPGASWCSHPAQPGGAHPGPAACARGLHLPQPRTWSSQPGDRRLHCLTWHQSSSGDTRR